MALGYAQSVTASSGATATTLTVNITPVTGNILYVCFRYFAAGNGWISDSSFLNTWSQVGTTQSVTAGSGTAYNCVVFWTKVMSSGVITITGTAASSTNRAIVAAEYTLPRSANPVDNVKQATASTSSSVATGNLVTAVDSDILILFIANNTSTTTTTPTNFTARQSGAIPIALYDNATPQVAGTYSAASTEGANTDWATFFIGSLFPSYSWLGASDTSNNWMDANSYYTSNPASPASLNAGMFIGGYTGLTWMKNVYCLARDVWTPSLSTPYSGQTYPTPNTGGAKTGETYPY